MKRVDETKLESILKELTLEEKIGMIHGGGLFRTNGVERLSIPPLHMSDGPMGVRKDFMNEDWIPAGETEDYVSYLPSNTALASTWNKELAKTAGHVLGEEARGRGKDVILAPGINIQRSPLCGRNFEYMSEDPELIKEIVVPFIKGIQEGTDVAACVKHFALNNQETDRLLVDTTVSDRALYEIYFPGFKAAVEKAGCYTIMGAYNLFRGEHCSQSKQLLNGILREEWGYDGAVISDWGAVHDTKEAALSGLDIEMSVTDNFNEYFMADPLLDMVRIGEISGQLIGALDEKVRNILRLMLRLHMIGDERELRNTGTYNVEAHRDAVLNTAREAIVLLKNESDRLPLKKGIRKLAVIGQNAMKFHSNGGGSAEIKALYEISPMMGLKKTLGGNTEIVYSKGYYIPEVANAKEINWQKASLEEQKEKENMFQVTKSVKEISQRYLEEAVALAKEAEEVLFIGGLNHEYDVEGKDRTTMTLPYEQDALIQALLEVNPNIVIVIMAGAPVAMDWSEKAKAIVWYSYAGMEGGTALAELLTGKINPSGKLPMTMPKKIEDVAAHQYGEFGNPKHISLKEGIYVGYRHFDYNKIEPLFCFGHGLSYSKFIYDMLEVEVEEEIGIDLQGKILKDSDIIRPFCVNVSVTIKNISQTDGAETIQVYVTDVAASVDRPLRELKGFEKIYLKAGEEKIVTIKLTMEAFGFYNEEKKCFEAEAGEFVISVGSSSRNIYLSEVIELEEGYCYTFHK